MTTSCLLHRWFLVSIAFCLMVLAVPAATHASVSFQNGWETGGVTGTGPNAWRNSQLVAQDRMQIVSDVVRNGSKALRVEVRPGDDPLGLNTERAEVLNMNGPSGTIAESEGTTVYYGFSVRADPNWVNPAPNSGQWSIIFQLHESDTLHPGSNPPFTFDMKGVFSIGTKGTDGVFRTINFSDNSLRKGEWVDFIFRVKWAKTKTGEVQVWRRNQDQTAFTQVALTTGISTLQDGTNSYWKQGQYRSKANVTSIFWLDNMTRADTYNEVLAVFGAGGGDIQVPSTPANLTVATISSSQINLSWSPSTDNVGVIGYDIYRDGALLTSVIGTTYQNTGLTANTTYSYQVRAKDAAGNISGYSSSVRATTLAGTQNPTVCLDTYTSTVAVPTGYGAAYNVFSASRELLVSVSSCTATEATVKVGNDSTDTLVYSQGWVWNGSWTKYSLTSDEPLVYSAWYPKSAAGKFALPATESRYYVAYVCTKVSDDWKCGCKDAACVVPAWQLQKVSR